MTVPAAIVFNHAAVSFQRSFSTRYMLDLSSVATANFYQFPALSMRRPAMAFSSQPTSISGTEESKRSV